MSIDFKRISRTAVSALGATSLLVTSLAIVSPVVVQAEATQGPTTKDELIAVTDGNIASLNREIASLDAQIAEVEAEITALETKAAEIQKQIDEQWAVVLEIWKKDYMRGDTSGIELIASRDTASELFSQQEYDGQFSEQLQNEVDKLFDLQDKNKKMLDEAKEKRDDLAKDRAEVEKDRATLEAQEAARQQAEQMKAEEVAQALAADKAEKAQSLASAGNSQPSGPSFGPVQGISGGNNPYPFGQCTWYVYSATGRGQRGNAGTWTPSSSTPAPGKIMIWGPGEQGASGAGHVGVVIGVSGNSVTVRHMNWGGAFGQVTTGTFSSTGKFW